MSSVIYQPGVADKIESQYARALRLAEQVARRAEIDGNTALAQKALSDRAEADLARHSLTRTLDSFGSVSVLDVLSSPDATRYVLLIARPDRPREVLKISGASLGGEPATYDAWAALPEATRPTTAEMVDYDQEHNRWILTEFVPGALASGPDRVVQVDFGTTMLLVSSLSGLAVPISELPAATQGRLATFSQAKTGGVAQSTGILAASALGEQWLHVKPQFDRVQRRLLSLPVYLVHGDAKATQAILCPTETYVPYQSRPAGADELDGYLATRLEPHWIDPAGITAFAAHDAGQLIAESGVTAEEQLVALAEAGARSSGAATADVLAAAGWYRLQYAGWRVFNESAELENALAEGRRPSTLPGPDAQALFASGQFLVGQALDMPRPGPSGDTPTLPPVR